MVDPNGWQRQTAPRLCPRVDVTRSLYNESRARVRDRGVQSLPIRLPRPDRVTWAGNRWSVVSNCSCCGGRSDAVYCCGCGDARSHRAVQTQRITLNEDVQPM
jgi:hypothetical protein